MCANSEGSGKTVRMRRLAWAFAGRLCDKYHNLMSWLNLPCWPGPWSHCQGSPDFCWYFVFLSIFDRSPPILLISHSRLNQLDSGYLQMIIQLKCFSFIIGNYRFLMGFFDLGFTAPSRLFHSFSAGSIVRWGENGRSPRKNTDHTQAELGLSHMWPELGSNH